MNLVVHDSRDDEPVWEDFTFHATDFRPEWNGDLVNVFTTIRPLPAMEETARLAVACTRELAAWVLRERKTFNEGDRFQLIVGWPKDVRPTARQIVKTGGGYRELGDIASGTAEVLPRKGWNAAIFDGE